MKSVHKKNSPKKFLVIFPLKKELFLFLKNSPLDFKKISLSNKDYYENKSMILTHGGHGKVNFALQKSH